MDESYLLDAARYIEMNPVTGGLVEHYRWSSARAHLGEEDRLHQASPLLERVGNWSNFLLMSSTEELTLRQRHEQSGRPSGSEVFTDKLEREMGRILRRRNPGLKKRDV